MDKGNAVLRGNMSSRGSPRTHPAEAPSHSILSLFALYTVTMEVFPGSYIAKISIGAASALGGIVVAIMAWRTGSAVSLTIP